MRLFHFVRRGNRYAFVCRVPSDLQQFFPKKVIWRSLKTSVTKDAVVLLKAEEYRLQRLFVQLRSGMFPKELEKWLVASYMLGGLELLEARTFGDPVERVADEKMPKELATEINEELRQRKVTDAEELQAEYEILQSSFRTREPLPLICKLSAGLVADYNKVNGTKIKPTAAEMDAFTLKILDAQVKLKGIERYVFENGQTYHLEQAKAELKERLQKPFLTFGEVKAAYLKWYEAENPDVKTYHSEVVPQCRVLAELLGENTGIDLVNTPQSISELKSRLRKYPKNKRKIFGEKSLSSIIRSGEEYDTLSLKRADMYFTRLFSILEFCRKRKFIVGNEAQGQSVSTKKERKAILPEDQRKGYDRADIERLVDALCTKPLSFQRESRDERFWIIITSFVHGIRTGNIVGLTKRHLKEQDGIWCIDLGEYTSQEVKTPDTRRVFTPVHPMLLYLGFVDWVNSLNRQKLFFDTVDSLSRWYNRNEIDHRTGRVAKGFEARFITTDPKKCLYSSRHVFGTAGNEVGVDVKVIKEMMGHAPDDRDQTRSRYAKRTSPQAQAEHQKKMMEYFSRIGFDAERLRARAKELFNLP
jgi:integrase